MRNALGIAVLVVLWHSFSMSISIYNKWMFSGQAISFPFPLFMTCLHQAVQFALSGLLLYLIPSLRPRRTTLPPSAVLPGGDPHGGMSLTRFYLTHLVPCGVATALDIGLGNMSLRFSTLTFMTVCKSSVLIFILLFAFLFRLEKLSAQLIVIIAFMTVGEVMMVLGEISFSAAGFSLVTASAFFSGFRWALTQLLILKHPATSNPISMLFFLSPVVCITLAGISLSLEDTKEMVKGLQALSSAWGGAMSLSLLLLPGVLAFCMVLSQFALLKRSSVVTLSVCGILKEVFIISAAGLVFGDQLTPVNICGVLVIMASIVAYNYTKLTGGHRAVEVKNFNEKHS
ncbi:triose-phosphate transporter family-domain-containing protein [Talaromyces proteolyticus]|uniref:Triose-phosphate transporter family-domain-containing protein n=1 Tax=Talaromyces proteolyticus TaxID=1131652 RepID=A0AAD4KGM2_9EURO|nr:triose-phosphate transporter family-domain-containing protein [Talaromyces proteolyticus]KAH8690648.1 triose-phosphate transporter family-domain-containing protein [Talaromyces proteolyticus]